MALIPREAVGMSPQPSPTPFGPDTEVDGPDDGTTPLLFREGSGDKNDLVTKDPADVDNAHRKPKQRLGFLGTLKVIAIGQFISLLLCATGVFSKLLVLRGVSLPTTQSFFNYVLLAVVYGPILARRGQLLPALRQHWLFFACIAVVDVEANYVIVKAFQYTNFTSVQLLSTAPLSWVLLLSRLVLKTQHSPRHYVGVVVGLVGTAGIIASDAIQAERANDDDTAAGSDPLLGDVLVLVATVLYACSNVGEEYTVRVLTKTHFLGMVGLFGTVVCGAQAAVLELDDARSVNWDFETTALLVGFVVSLFAMYSLVPVLISWSSAMVFNLSMLSADVYSFVVGIFLFKTSFFWLYFVAFPVVLAGLAIYLSAPEAKHPVLKLPGLGVKGARHGAGAGPARAAAVSSHA